MSPESVSAAAVSPLGGRGWVGGALGLLYIWTAVWTVLDRVGTRFVQSLGHGELSAWYETATRLIAYGLGALAVIALLAAAMRSTDSLPDKGAFALLAASEALMSVGMLGGLWLRSGAAFYTAAILVPLAYLGRSAGLLVMYVNRENCRDGRGTAFVAGLVQLTQALGAVVTNYAAWQILRGSGFGEVWLRLLTISGNGVFFASIAAGVLVGLTFWLLRVPVAVPQYPEKNRF